VPSGVVSVDVVVVVVPFEVAVPVLLTVREPVVASWAFSRLKV
jgi:hypothetical protein